MCIRDRYLNLLKKLALKHKKIDYYYYHLIPVINETKKLSKKYSLKEMAILVRANISAPNYLDALKTLGIPAIYSGISGLYSQTDVLMLINIMKTIYSHSDPLVFYHFLVSEINNLQVSEIMPIEPLREKYQAFGWKVFEVDGSNIQELLNEFEKAKKGIGKPKVIISYLIKGITNCKFCRKFCYSSSTSDFHRLNLFCSFENFFHKFIWFSLDIKSIEMFLITHCILQFRSAGSLVVGQRPSEALARVQIPARAYFFRILKLRNIQLMSCV